jgi:hypothetical protein
MHSAWLRNHKDKQKRRQEVLGAAWAFNMLKEVLEEEFRRKENIRDYDDPQWVHKQIAANEYNQALDDLLKLITFEKDDR